MTTPSTRRRVHLARDGTSLTACGLLVAGLSERSELVAGALGARGTWRPLATWYRDTPGPWRCARCHRALMAWSAARTRRGQARTPEWATHGAPAAR